MTDLRTEERQLEAGFPLLNPGERVAVTVTAIGDTDIPAPEVTARAVGITATARRDESTIAPSFVWAVIAGATGVVVALTSLTFSVTRERATLAGSLEDLRKRVEETKLPQSSQDKGSPDSAQIVFAILNRAGVSHVMARLAETGDVTYWRTGVLLVHSFLLDDMANQPKYVAALEDLVSRPMAVSSLGFNLYLLAKLEAFRGNHGKATEHLSRCKNEAPAMYEHLMKHDTTYDLRRVQQELRRSRR